MSQVRASLWFTLEVFTAQHCLSLLQDFQTRMDTHPRKVIDRETVPLLAHTIRQVSEFLGCEALDLVLIDSVELAVSTILRSLPLAEGDTILTLSTGSGENPTPTSLYHTLNQISFKPSWEVSCGRVVLSTVFLQPWKIYIIRTPLYPAGNQIISADLELCSHWYFTTL